MGSKLRLAYGWRRISSWLFCSLPELVRTDGYLSVMMGLGKILGCQNFPPNIITSPTCGEYGQVGDWGLPNPVLRPKPGFDSWLPESISPSWSSLETVSLGCMHVRLRFVPARCDLVASREVLRSFCGYYTWLPVWFQPLVVGHCVFPLSTLAPYSCRV